MEFVIGVSAGEPLHSVGSVKVQFSVTAVSDSGGLVGHAKTAEAFCEQKAGETYVGPDRAGRMEVWAVLLSDFIDGGLGGET